MLLARGAPQLQLQPPPSKASISENQVTAEDLATITSVGFGAQSQLIHSQGRLDPTKAEASMCLPHSLACPQQERDVG